MNTITMHKAAGQVAALEVLGLHKTANVMEQLKDYLRPHFNTYVKNPLKDYLRDPRAIPNLADYGLRVIPHSLGGAAVGGISGALNADEGERLRGAGYGALTGGLLGAGIGAADAALIQHRGKGYADIIQMDEGIRQLNRTLQNPHIPAELRSAGKELDARLYQDTKDAVKANLLQSMLAAPAATLTGSAVGGGIAGGSRSKSDRD